MKHLFSILIVFQLVISSIYADFCSEVQPSLKKLVDHSELIQGKLETITPFPDQQKKLL